MKIEYLRYFMEIAKANSINQAAKNLYISQQQLNNILTSLEQELHTTLFARSNKGVSLTEDGTAFIKFAEKLLTDYSAMQNYFYLRQFSSNLASQRVRGQCTLHTPPVVSIFLSDIICKFKETAPNVDLRCIAESPLNTVAPVEEGHLYLWSFYNPDSLDVADDIASNVIPIGSFDACLFVNKHAPIAQRKTVKHEDVYRLIDIRFSSVPDENYQSENIVLVSSNPYQMLDSVTQNRQVCILPHFVFPKMAALYPDIVTLPFEESTCFSLRIVYAPSYVLTAADEVLISFLKFYLQNQQLLAQQSK